MKKKVVEKASGPFLGTSHKKGPDTFFSLFLGPRLYSSLAMKYSAFPTHAYKFRIPVRVRKGPPQQSRQVEGKSVRRRNEKSNQAQQTLRCPGQKLEFRRCPT
ncbi:MAG: hypothetical protein K2X00_12375 [Nitrospiraceae bacterium]|nr:hypothetical protein [Nitrospiraceae bacterium]